MKRLMSITITLLFVFTLVFAAQVAETQAQPHMGDDHMNDSPWDDDDHMNDSPWDDDDHMNDSPQYNNMPAMYWMYLWMLYMWLFMGPGV